MSKKSGTGRNVGTEYDNVHYGKLQDGKFSKKEITTLNFNLKIQ